MYISSMAVVVFPAAASSVLVQPDWEWEPAQTQWVQHCLQVPTVNGSWDHEVFNRSDHSWPLVNETVTWANNSRLLTLAVPEGTPPPGGWPVLMDLLVVDYPTRLPSDRGVDKETAKQICGLDGGTFADPAATSPSRAKARCGAAAKMLCGKALSGGYNTCIGCMLNATIRSTLLGPHPPSGGSWTGPCSPGTLQELTFGDIADGGLCPPAPPLPTTCVAFIDNKCSWTKAIRNASIVASGKERVDLWRDYTRNCSSCLERSLEVSNTSISGCPYSNWSTATEPAAARQEMLDGYCKIESPPWAHKRGKNGNFFTVRAP